MKRQHLVSVSFWKRHHDNIQGPYLNVAFTNLPLLSGPSWRRLVQVTSRLGYDVGRADDA